MGANVIRIDRKGPTGLGFEYAGPKADIRRGRPSVAVDPSIPSVETVLRLVESADAIVDPMRPGVMERLGLGPDVCMARNPRLIYGRMTGWGQTGPLADVAGTTSTTFPCRGCCMPSAPRNARPTAQRHRRYGWRRDVPGQGPPRRPARSQEFRSRPGRRHRHDGRFGLSRHGLFGLASSGHWKDERESNLLDGGAPFWRCYETKDGKHISLGCVEEKFYNLLMETLDIDPASLPPQLEPESWPEIIALLDAKFAEKTRDEWCEIMEGTDICFAPVLSFSEAPIIRTTRLAAVSSRSTATSPRRVSAARPQREVRPARIWRADGGSSLRLGVFRPRHLRFESGGRDRRENEPERHIGRHPCSRPVAAIGRTALHLAVVRHGGGSHPDDNPHSSDRCRGPCSTARMGPRSKNETRAISGSRS